MVDAVASPDVLPGFVAQYSLSFDPMNLDDWSAFAGIELPARLENAIGKRKFEFLAGRHCAAEAMRGLLRTPSAPAVGIAPDRSPQWPAGIVGSITHCAGFASAAVARQDDAQGLGIDSEIVMDEKRAGRIGHMVADEQELARLEEATHIAAPLLLTVVFSAKEALYKCLYPSVGRYFGFPAARIVAIDARRQRFEATLQIALGAALPAGTSVRGRYVIESGRVHTGIFIP